jgi:zinc-binding alcohol dehydrogenase family protein
MRASPAIDKGRAGDGSGTTDNGPTSLPGAAAMKAVALTRYLPIADPASLFDVELPRPEPGAHDLLVRVEAVSVNPVDTKLRAPKPQMEAQPKVLGYDAAGTVEAVGAEVQGFRSGDRVYYAGDVTRQGSNAEFQLVDARLAATMPRTLDFAQAAALPLVAITAWELLFQRMPFDSEHGGKGKSLLVIAGAGGVGSIAIQLARRAGFAVIATASRPETMDWCRAMGAQHVINHREPLAPQLAALGHSQIDAALNLADTDRYWDALGELLAPQGHVGLIVEPKDVLRIGDPYKAKCIGIHWEFMFARARWKTPDMAEQGRILARVAQLIDAGELKSIQREALNPINAANLREAHRRLESGATVGKLVLAGW